jgi:hypothetical protein
MFQTIHDDPGWGWYGTPCASFASYRIAGPAGLSNKGALKIIVGASLVAPLFYLILMLTMLYQLGANRIGVGVWLSSQGLLTNWLPSDWATLPGIERTPQLMAGFIIVGQLTFLHARFVWFPFEPMGFMLAIMLTSILAGYWFPFLIAWVVKVITLQIGGSNLYERTGMPVAGGILAGTIVAVLFGGIIGVVRFFFPVLESRPFTSFFLLLALELVP